MKTKKKKKPIDWAALVAVVERARYIIARTPRSTNAVIVQPLVKLLERTITQRESRGNIFLYIPIFLTRKKQDAFYKLSKMYPY